jgi:hypothetical protein
VSLEAQAMEYAVSVLFIRQRCKEINREPIQLDLFIPQTYGYQYTVLVTNKTVGMRKVLRFHHGRGYQEVGEMNWPPMLIHIKVRNPKTNFGCWFPLFLLFPFVLAVLIILLPFR